MGNAVVTAAVGAAAVSATVTEDPAERIRISRTVGCGVVAFCPPGHATRKDAVGSVRWLLPRQLPDDRVQHGYASVPDEWEAVNR